MTYDIYIYIHTNINNTCLLTRTFARKLALLPSKRKPELVFQCNIETSCSLYGRLARPAKTKYFKEAYVCYKEQVHKR